MWSPEELKEEAIRLSKAKGLKYDTALNSILSKNNLFGLSFTLEEIGYVLGVTRERVRQIESSALKKIKHPKIGRKLKEYLHEE